MAIDLTGYDPWSSVGGDMTGETVPTSSSGSSAFSNIAGAIGSYAAGPAGGLIGSVLGGLFGGGSDKRAARQARRAAQRQMDFQERMSNTQMQRRVADLKAAGLNPMLAGLNQEGASAPSGAMPQVYNSGVAKAHSAQQGAAIGRDTGMTIMSLIKTMAETQLASAQATKAQAELPYITAQTGQAESASSRNYAEIVRLANQNDLTVAEVANARQTWQKLQAETDLTIEQRLKIMLHENPKLDLESAKTLAEYFKIHAETGNITQETRSKTAVGDIAEAIRVPDAANFATSAAKSAGETAGKVRMWFDGDSKRRTSKGYKP